MLHRLCFKLQSRSNEDVADSRSSHVTPLSPGCWAAQAPIKAREIFLLDFPWRHGSTKYDSLSFPLSEPGQPFQNATLMSLASLFSLTPAQMLRIGVTHFQVCPKSAKCTRVMGFILVCSCCDTPFPLDAVAPATTTVSESPMAENPTSSIHCSHWEANRFGTLPLRTADVRKNHTNLEQNISQTKSRSRQRDRRV